MTGLVNPSTGAEHNRAPGGATASQGPRLNAHKYHLWTCSGAVERLTTNRPTARGYPHLGARFAASRMSVESVLNNDRDRRRVLVRLEAAPFLSRFDQ